MYLAKILDLPPDGCADSFCPPLPYRLIGKEKSVSFFQWWSMSKSVYSEAKGTSIYKGVIPTTTTTATTSTTFEAARTRTLDSNENGNPEDHDPSSPVKREEEQEDTLATTTTTTPPSLFSRLLELAKDTWFETPLAIMGACLSSGGESYIEGNDGGEEQFHSRFLEDKVLGEGQFGVVKLVHDMKANRGEGETMACKILRKGVVFKDNVLYTPLKPEVLKSECDILRTLAGKHYCLHLEAVFETKKNIFVVTELCAGGEMMEYVSKQNWTSRFAFHAFKNTGL